MKGDEERVDSLFRAWLASEGWTVAPEPPATLKWLDIYATRDDGSGDEVLAAECKGHAGADAGASLDIGYGQLLRRMDPNTTHIRYAIVVPPESERAATRVPPGVRERLDIIVYVVTEDGAVRLATEPA